VAPENGPLDFQRVQQIESLDRSATMKIRRQFFEAARTTVA